MRELSAAVAAETPSVLQLRPSSIHPLRSLLRLTTIACAIGGSWYLAKGLLLTWQTQRVSCAVGTALVLMMIGAGSHVLRHRRLGHS